MLESEAKTKWCPFVRHIADIDDHTNSNRGTEVTDEYNKEFGNPEYSRCIGSRCMAWRWEKKPIKKGEFIAQNIYREGFGIAATEMLPSQENVDGDGYCGLAGKL